MKGIGVVCMALLALDGGAASAQSLFRDGLEASVWLEGRVLHADPVAAAQVMLIDGDREIVVQTGPDGRYRLHSGDVFDTARVPRLVARGVGADAHIEFRSYPGSYRQLLDRADATATVTDDDLVGLRLTPVATAYAALFDNLIAGGPRREAELRRAATSYVVHDFEVLAQAGQGLANGDIALPAGAITLWDALVDPLQAAIVSSAVYALPLAQREALTAQLVADQFAPLEETILDRWLLAYQAQTTSFFTTYGGMQLTADGRGRFRNDKHDVAGSWTRTGHETDLRVDGNGVFTSEHVALREIAPGQFATVRVQNFDVGYRLQLFQGPATTRVGKLEIDQESRFPDHPQLATEPRVAEGSDLAWSLFDSPATPRYPLASIGGKTLLLPTCFPTGCAIDPPSLSSRVLLAEPHEFRTDGGGRTRRLARDFTWRIAQGVLHIDYADGADAQVAQLSNEAPGALGVAGVHYRMADGQQRLLVQSMVTEQQSTSPLTGIAPGRFRYSYPASSAHRVAYNEDFFSQTFDLQPGGGGTRTSRTTGAVLPVQWASPAPGVLTVDVILPDRISPRFIWQFFNRDGAIAIGTETFTQSTVTGVDAPPVSLVPTSRITMVKVLP